MPSTQDTFQSVDTDSDPQAWLKGFRQSLADIGSGYADLPDRSIPGLLGDLTSLGQGAGSDDGPARLGPGPVQVASTGAAPAAPTSHQPAPMILSSDGEDFIKRQEGWHGQGKASIEGGSDTAFWGHKLQPGENPQRMDPEQTFQTDVANAEAKVNGATQGVPLDQSQFDALTSFAYNMPSAFTPRRDNLFLQRLEQGDLQGAADRMPLWNKASKGGSKVALPGLTARRNAERNLFLDGGYGND